MKKILIIFFLFFSFKGIAQQNPSVQPGNNTKTIWLPRYDFNPSSFKSPQQNFGPMARWWWPGNLVTQAELKREINLYADNDFAGLEVQPMNLVIPTSSPDERAKITSWDTPDYYENLRTVMDEARRRNLIIDMTFGSGWPPAGPDLKREDGFLSLEFSDTTVSGGKALSFPLPLLPPSKNTTTVAPLLQAVVIESILPNIAGENGTIHLDVASSKVVTSKVHNDILSFSFPAGNWNVIAFWAIPSGEKASLSATPKPITVVNHLDSSKVLKLLNYLFGKRTGLQPYFGNPMRAVFADSYEFTVNRLYSLNFISYFQKHRGYDITPYLPANMQKGYNYVSYMRQNAPPDFSFSKQDWRLRYDYDLTISELLGENFIKTSRSWTEKRDLLFRTQAYGLNMDMIAQAGLASIPETESMLGTEMNIKIMTSGGHLYNRPVESAESIVFKDRAYTTTPQMERLAVDKLFAAGVNQIIYHGVPYHYTPKQLGPEGWYPFSTPLIPFINFSSNLGEGNIFWKYQKDVNEYINRTQYALRSGKAKADVLIYFPFMSVDGMPDNPEEIMTQGYIKDTKATLKTNIVGGDSVKNKWAEVVYPLINQLEANGITWDWVNDVSIQQASLNSSKQINIRGNIYQALILANDSIIQTKSAQQINKLAEKGMNLMAIGTLPNKQPSFLNWKVNDERTEKLIADALKRKSSTYIQNKIELKNWIKKLNRSISFNGEYSFTREAQREMNDGSRIRFIWNKSDAWQTISLTLNKKFVYSYWMNADDGAITKNNGSIVSYKLPPYSSIILYASTKNSPVANNMIKQVINVDENNAILSIDKWNVKVDSIEIKDTSLFDWKNSNQLKFSSAEGIYTSSFQWNDNNVLSHYFLDLGRVCFTAEVYINGKFAGKRIYSPYQLDITSFLHQGTNEIEVHVTSGQLNGFIGKAKNGDARYKQFKGKESQVMSAGLIGPVSIRPGK